MRSKMFITAAFNEEECVSGMSNFSKKNAEEAVRAYEAGAAIAYIYTGNSQNGDSEKRKDAIRKTLEFIRSRCDVICCVKMGIPLLNQSEDKFVPVAVFKPELATLDVGLSSFGIPGIIEMAWDEVGWNAPSFVSMREADFAKRCNLLEKNIRTMNENGTRPEFVVYDVATINNIAHFVKEGIIKTPVYMQFVLGIAGGIPASVTNLTFLYNTACRSLGKENFFWSVEGVGKSQIRMASAGLALGGNIRVTLSANDENALGLGQPIGEQIATVRDMAMTMGYDVATSTDVRRMMALKGADKIVL